MASSFITQVASSVPFDNETNGFIAEDTQAAIEEIAAKAKNSLYIPFISTENLNYAEYLYAYQHDGLLGRRSGNNSNGWQFQNSSPAVVPFSGKVVSAVFRNRGIAQSTGSPAATMTLRYELFRVGVTGGAGTKLGDIIVSFSTAGKIIGNFWNSAVNTNLNEQASVDISVSQGDLLGLRFNPQSGNSEVRSFHNAAVILKIEED